MRFGTGEEYEKHDVFAAIERDDPQELLHVPVALSMYDPDYDFALSICLELSRHPDPTVKGNAILGFGHLARRFRKMDEARTRPIVEQALGHEDFHVSGHAHSAADDISFFTDWHFEGRGAEKAPYYEFLDVTILRFVDPDQPGWVECELADAAGKKWLFREKVPIVTDRDLDENSEYPQPGVIACEVVGRRRDEHGWETITVNTEVPDGVESVDGQTRFDVPPYAVLADSQDKIVRVITRMILAMKSQGADEIRLELEGTECELSGLELDLAEAEMRLLPSAMKLLRVMSAVDASDYGRKQVGAFDLHLERYGDMTLYVESTPSESGEIIRIYEEPRGSRA